MARPLTPPPHHFGRKGEAPPPGTVTGNQVHGTVVLRLGGHPPALSGADGDVVLTHLPGATVGVRTADCLPLLLSARNGTVVAAVHAGWRGTVAQVAAAAVRAMESDHGVTPKEIHAWLGPCIRPCCYEVGPELAATVREHFPQWAGQVIGTFRSGRPTLDVALLNRLQLTALGVTRIDDSGACTHCHNGYESYRRDGAASGRMVSWIRCAPEEPA
ncbi:MAG: peptidoglycan editing factor PgeF [Nitrospirota bacterium]|nr:peptidoglycan editing factor PgeF [Nitrospirota bacterium]